MLIGHEHGVVPRGEIAQADLSATGAQAHRGEPVAVGRDRRPLLGGPSAREARLGTVIRPDPEQRASSAAAHEDHAPIARHDGLAIELRGFGKLLRSIRGGARCAHAHPPDRGVPAPIRRKHDRATVWCPRGLAVRRAARRDPRPLPRGREHPELAFGADRESAVFRVRWLANRGGRIGRRRLLGRRGCLQERGEGK